MIDYLLGNIDASDISDQNQNKFHCVVSDSSITSHFPHLSFTHVTFHNTTYLVSDDLLSESEISDIYSISNSVWIIQPKQIFPRNYIESDSKEVS